LIHLIHFSDADRDRNATRNRPGPQRGDSGREQLKLAVHASTFVNAFSARIGENIVSHGAPA
jgi:hypothetical protein